MSDNLVIQLYNEYNLQSKLYKIKYYKKIMTYYEEHTERKATVSVNFVLINYHSNVHGNRVGLSLYRYYSNTFFNYM